MSHTRRNYGQYCGLATALDVVGERWTLLIVRELLFGPRRYGDLLAALPGVGTNLLAERLKFLTAQGMLRKVASSNPKDKGYELTELGWQLRQPVLDLARWGLTFLGAPSDDQEVRPHWGFLAVQAMMDVSRAPDIDEAYEFQVADAVFHILVEGGKPCAVEGPYEGTPAMVAVTDARTFVEIGAKHLTPFAAVASGRLTLRGDAEAVMRASALLGLDSGVPAAVGKELSATG
jgi:DNA-binding HxlR family transcriptional regulator/putative sterol carrier protein